jgi:hypothetical protein
MPCRIALESLNIFAADSASEYVGELEKDGGDGDDDEDDDKDVSCIFSQVRLCLPYE